MRVVLFIHSLDSDWNHGNAHFLRGVASELKSRGHDVRIFEPVDSWSRTHLVREQGESAISQFHAAYPGLTSSKYDLPSLNLDAAFEGAGLVIVHEWNSPGLIERVGRHRRAGGRYALLFHDTHHRMITQFEESWIHSLSNYDGVLAFGESLRGKYVSRGFRKPVWVWHEAADLRVFQPMPAPTYEGDVVWIGNWGDEERTAELREFFIDPVRDLRLQARAHGVRYPVAALDELRAAGIEYRGWAPNFKTPDIYATFRFTLHIPRRPYTASLPGIPTIRVFEALACGIPLICSPWDDTEGLFTPGKDFMVARNGEDMKRCMEALATDEWLRARLARHGIQTIRRRHTCGHRVDELLAIYRDLVTSGVDTMRQGRTV